LIQQFSYFLKGFSSFFRALPFLFEKKLWKFLFVPALIWIILFFFSWYISTISGNTIRDIFRDTILEYLPKENEWFLKMYRVIEWVLNLAIRLVVWWILSSFIKYVVLIMLSPVLALLSEKADEMITGKTYPFTFSNFLRDIRRGIRMALRNMMREYFLIILCAIVSFIIPFAFVITTPFLLLVSWYYSGLSFVDYTLERRGYTLNESITYAQKNKGWICGIGAAFSIMMAFDNPFSLFSAAWFFILIIKLLFGLVLFSLTPLLAGIASTRMFIEQEKNVSTL
jgi:CysZ protein